MRARYGSMRYWLAQSKMVSMPSNLRPFHEKWKFRKERDAKAARRYAMQLRRISDRILEKAGDE